MPSSRRRVNGSATWNSAFEQAQGWDDTVLLCRIRGHIWDQDNSRKEGRRYVVFFECTRGCGVRKTERWDNQGRIMSAHAVYPKDADGNPTYLSTIGRFDRDMRGALRIETLTRRGEV